ncbi:MAG TPA: lipocalin-like domain-containing protein [Amycolatopsis sp.]|nr:lipocalin-like domain-containing protein [Amycolatopsis sp.]
MTTEKPAHGEGAHEIGWAGSGAGAGSGAPVWVAPAFDLAAHGIEARDSWWFASRVTTGSVRFDLKIHALITGENCLSTVAIRRHDTGEVTATHVADPLGDVVSSTSKFEVRTPLLSLRGDLDNLSIEASSGETRVSLALHRVGPTLYNAGTGHFPFFGASTYQYALPGLNASGTVSLAGTEHAVTGETWFDRQWSSGARTRPARFTWLGLNLGHGHHLSVWDTVGDGTSWVTILRPDGTHTIAAAHRTGGDGRWRLVVPALEADLTVDHLLLDEVPSFPLSTVVCEVTGGLAGRAVAGHGFADLIG